MFSSDAAVAYDVTACLCRDFSDLGSILAAGGSTTINGSGCDSESVQMDGLLVAFHDMRCSRVIMCRCGTVGVVRIGRGDVINAL